MVKMVKGNKEEEDYSRRRKMWKRPAGFVLRPISKNKESLPQDHFIMNPIQKKAFYNNQCKSSKEIRDEELDNNKIIAEEKEKQEGGGGGRGGGGGPKERRKTKKKGNGIKRNGFGGGGVVHAIKKPRKKLKTIKKTQSPPPPPPPHPPPSCNSKTPPKKKGGLEGVCKGVLKERSVDHQISFSFRGGQMVFTKTLSKPSDKTTPTRKPSSSPNLQNRKLFSPSNSFLSPSPSKSLSPLKSFHPSPVKFDSIQDLDVDVADIIQELDKANDDDVAKPCYVTDEELKKIAIETEEQIRHLNPFENDVVGHINDDASRDESSDQMHQNIRDILSTIPPKLTQHPLDDHENVEPSGSNLGSLLFPIFNNPKSGLRDISSSKVEKSTSKKFIGGLRDEGNKRQTVIDAGQNKIGPQFCLSCNTIYTLGDPEDERQHDLKHNGVSDIIKFNGWKNEQVVRHYPEIGRRIIKVDLFQESKRKHWEYTKIESILKYVDETLGSPASDLSKLKNPAVFMYISDKKVVGFVLAESVKKAYPMNSDNTYEVDKPQKVALGISRLWVHPEYRKSKIATDLIDSLRENYYFPYQTIPKNQLAFSQTTPDGTLFARNYSNTYNFLTYIPN